MDQQETKDKFESAQRFFKSCKMLSEIGIRENDAQLDFSITCYFLYSVIFELIIKILYELDTNKLCSKTHELEKLYNNLNINCGNIELR